MESMGTSPYLVATQGRGSPAHKRASGTTRIAVRPEMHEMFMVAE